MVVTALVLGGGVLYRSTHPPRDPLTPAQARHIAEATRAADASYEANRPRVVSWLGDSYTGGSNMGGGEGGGFPKIVSEHFGWQWLYGTVQAVGGTGYVARGPHGTDERFITRVPGIVRGHPDIVIVAGGINESGEPYDTVEPAALEVLRQLRQGLPKARIVVLGPFYPRNPPASVYEVRRAIFDAAHQVGITDLIDPLPWFTGPDAVQIGTDGTHPTDQGHQQIAAHLIPALEALGFQAKPRAGTGQG